MKRALIVGLLLVVLAPDTVSARGGRDRGPQGAVPPLMRRPWDPTQPAPPSALAAPTPPRVTLPPVTGPRPPRSKRGRRKRAEDANQFSFADWSFWYAYNRETLEPRTEAAATFSRNRAFVAKHIAPALLEALEQKDLPRIARSAAGIALGKVATTPNHVAALQAILASEEEDRYVQESTAIALGLLCRTASEQQFKGELLDSVRSDLERTMRNEERRARCRGFAAIAVALLADQPTSLMTGSAQRLLDFALTPHKRPELSVAGLTAVGLLPPASLSESDLNQLRNYWRDGLEGKTAFLPMMYLHAASALGRIGSAADVPLLTRALTSSRKIPGDQRSALIALGTLSTRLGSDVRSEVLDSIRTALKRKNVLTDPTARNLAFITLARIGRAQAATGDDSEGIVLAAGALLLTHADAARSKTRNTYAALGLGWLSDAAAVLPGKAVLAWRKKAHKVLLSAIKKRKLSPHDRAGHDLALGFVAEDEDLDVLVALLRDRKEPAQRRAACATALARHGGSVSGLVGLLSSTVRGGRSEALLSASIRSLGLLAADRAQPLLAEQLTRQRSLTVKGTCAIALANLGTETAAQRLLSLARNPAENPLTRAVAYAGLGLVGDPEPTPTLARITSHLNWRAMDDVLNELCALL